MRRGVVCGVVGGMVLAVVATSGAAERRTICSNEIEAAAKKNAELAWYLDRNGMPDVAELRPLSDKAPWDNHEIVLYYLDDRREIAFARALMLGQLDVSMQRVERTLTDEDVAALSASSDLCASERARSGGEYDAGVDPTDPVARAEAAALRAEQAAGKVEEAALRTEQAAARAEAVVEKMLARAR